MFSKFRSFIKLQEIGLIIIFALFFNKNQYLKIKIVFSLTLKTMETDTNSNFIITISLQLDCANL